ncbi:MAG: pilus assembly protein TadB [Actinomycetales bacterium]|nr:pilus assembly protein TadB [Actinomycetales bacterium]
MTAQAIGAAAGALGGLGAVLLLAWLSSLRAPRLDDRLAPYLSDAAGSRLLPVDPVPRGPLADLLRLFAPWAGEVLGRAERWAGSSSVTGSLLLRAASGSSVEEYRAEQVAWAVVGAGVGAAAGWVGGNTGIVPLVGFVVAGALAGALARSQLLVRAARRRDERILAEFPAVAELLALAVGAGEGAAAALERVAGVCTGELAVELRRTLAETAAGVPLVPALEAMAARTSLPAVARFVDGLAVAVDRGTPLAEVLHAQAQDVRELSRRRLLEIGGRREIAMMVPVVFLILPVTVVFAAFPGLAVLELGP